MSHNSQYCYQDSCSRKEHIFVQPQLWQITKHLGVKEGQKSEEEKTWKEKEKGATNKEAAAGSSSKTRETNNEAVLLSSSKLEL